MHELVDPRTEGIAEFGVPAAGTVHHVPADMPHGIEKFTATDLAALRSDMLQSGVDSFQAADLVTSFLSGRGYGISTHEARVVVSKIEGMAYPLESIQTELERVAHFA